MGTDKLPVWKESYSKLGVSPRELYMRQQGLCWLTTFTLPDTSVEVYCTDGKDRAKTNCMLNPTIECATCMSSFVSKTIEAINDRH